ncbi:MAG: cytochrome d ubiquinol oxidase subunit II [Gammaproteobacteria bacterium]
MEAYVVLKIIWWLLLGVLFMAIGIMIGQDMGVGTSLRYLGRSEHERRAVLNMIGPHWDGNQVWFVLGGGALFAAFPTVYATLFSGLYIVMLILLWAMIVRPLGFEYRGKLESARWRGWWDRMLFISGFVPMLVFGTAIGNALMGFPFRFNDMMQTFYPNGFGFYTLFNPFSVIICGLMAVALSLYQAGAMISLRSEGVILARAKRMMGVATVAAIALFTAGGIWLSQLNGYTPSGVVHPGMAAAPLASTATMAKGVWLHNFFAHPALFIVPILVYIALLAGLWCVHRGRTKWAWWSGALTWMATVGTVGAALFPMIAPSYTNVNQSLTVWNSTSSLRTLAWMLGFAAIFIPLIILYTSWAFRVMRGKISPEDIAERDKKGEESY